MNSNISKNSQECTIKSPIHTYCSIACIFFSLFWSNLSLFGNEFHNMLFSHSCMLKKGSLYLLSRFKLICFEIHTESIKHVVIYVLVHMRKINVFIGFLAWGWSHYQPRLSNKTNGEKCIIIRMPCLKEWTLQFTRSVILHQHLQIYFT